MENLINASKATTAAIEMCEKSIRAAYNRGQTAAQKRPPFGNNNNKKTLILATLAVVEQQRLERSKWRKQQQKRRVQWKTRSTLILIESRRSID